jgi:phosphoribosylanthranilate isomerase
MWIKICGLTGADAVAAAVAAGADAIGFVFAASVRRVSPATAAALAASARGRCALVAVTLHPDQSLIDEIVHVLRPDLLQTDLGDLPALRLPASLGCLPVLRAAPAGTVGAAPGALPVPDPAAAASRVAEERGLPPRLLYESPSSGSGVPVDWSRAAVMARQHELVLAGGLTPGNVGEAIARVRPYGVDVSSGVEAAPGRKDPALIARFVQAAREAAARLAAPGTAAASPATMTHTTAARP